MEEIVQYIQEQENIIELNLDNKNISDLSQLIKPLQQLQYLEVLSLENNNLKKFPKLNLPNLKYLNVSGNKFDSFVKTVEALKKLKNLEELNMDIQENNIIYVKNEMPNINILNGDQVSTKRNIVQDIQDEPSQINPIVDLEFYHKISDQLINLNRFSKHVLGPSESLQNHFDEQFNAQPRHDNKSKLQLLDTVGDILIQYLINLDPRISSSVSDILKEYKTVIQDYQQAQRYRNSNSESARIINFWKGENKELKEQIEDLQEQNSKYLEQIIKLTKSKVDKSYDNSQFQSNYPQSIQQKSNNQLNHSPSRENLNDPQNQTFSQEKTDVRISFNQGNKIISLKQLKEIINEIYTSKQKQDKVNEEQQIPIETMEQHMYTYLNQKYGLKSLTIDWAQSIVNGLQQFSLLDNDITLFSKILKNECDEEFRYVQQQVKQTIKELLKIHLKNKYQSKDDQYINNIWNQKMNSFITEDESYDIINYMFNEQNALAFKEQIQEYLVKEVDISPQKPNQKKTKKQDCLRYQEFEKIILDYQLKTHVSILQVLIQSFKEVDADDDGIISQEEFMKILDSEYLIMNQEQKEEFLQIIDPFERSQITFTQCVQLFSTQNLVVDAVERSLLDQMNYQVLNKNQY